MIDIDINIKSELLNRIFIYQKTLFVEGDINDSEKTMLHNMTNSGLFFGKINRNNESTLKWISYWNNIFNKKGVYKIIDNGTFLSFPEIKSVQHECSDIKPAPNSVSDNQ